MDRSNGYEALAERFIAHRESDPKQIGASAVSRWAKSVVPGSAVLDLGCGSGIPVSRALMQAGMTVYGIDASPAMVDRFRQNFRQCQVACEAVEDSAFFDLQFDAVVAWGLMFLLPAGIQEKLIHKVADVLKYGGRFLFTAPAQTTEWKDVMTGHTSRSLGAERYRELLTASGFRLPEEFRDEAGNYYFSSVKA